MANEKTEKKWKSKKMHGGGPGGSVYGLGLIGALVYFIGHAANFWDGVLGVLEAFVWPAILIYHALKSIGI